jgi:TolA-binding protein
MYNIANYNLGYCFFKTNDYNESQSWFRKFLAKRNPNETDIYNDALIRTGDCFYGMRDFDNSLSYYNDAISAKASSSDYALYQKGVIQGLQGNMDAKAQTLSNLMNSYPRSRYRADAIYERGKAYMSKGDGTQAQTNFSQLLKEFPGSQYGKKAQLNIGLIYYNDKQDEKAIEQLKKVISTYPGTSEATEALTSVKNIYVEDGKAEEYFAFVKNIPNASVSIGAQDSITYQVAEQRYLKSNFEDAAKDFNKYLTQFPNGAYRLNATFYLAECNFRNKIFGEALSGYETIIGEPKNIYSEKSLLKAGNINFKNKEYMKSLQQYGVLERDAEMRDNILFAQTGIMRASYLIANYGQAIAYAKKLIEGEKVSNELIAESHLIYGRSAMKLEDYAAAKKEFIIISKQSSDAGAEAKYSLALIDYKMGNFKTSQAKCYDVANQVPSYDYWIAKSFMLLADNHLALNDKFEAKATLQSLLDNYEKDPSDIEDIKAIAQEKLDDLVLIEMNENKAPAPLPDPETDLNQEKN